jgi:endonuclease/exonuclease/phosphatase family metal-dependent hydrolase
MTLTRLPLRDWKNHHLTKRIREQRGVLQTAVEIAKGETLQVFNVHLGTGFMERRHQAKRLLGPAILAQPEMTGPRLVVGDFNEWTKGLTTNLLRKDFHSFRPRHALHYPRTYPGVLPFLSLDHFYYEPPLQLVKSRLWRTRRALIASDHLPPSMDKQVPS